MSAPNDGGSSPRSQLSSHFLGELLDSIIVDVASECHRIARLEELRLSKQARVADPSSSGGGAATGGGGGETNSKYVPVGHRRRFAPHLEKCMGKGRKARLKTTRSSTITQSRHSRGSPVTVYAPHAGGGAAGRVSNGGGMGAVEYPELGFEEP
ncbi:unnamed protein product [Spirodela intermedia]|uniref:SAGA-associated factor 11 n=1 Tax=Spirodela intermedia TaxID=51605 RepID=A0ABN7EC38_SPIIN|nr:unnamed protein product [Spirodela intermedia]